MEENLKKSQTTSSMDPTTNTIHFNPKSSECSASAVLYSSLNSKAILNVGGVRHEIMWDKLARFPNTRLGRLAGLHKSIISSLSTVPHDELLNICDDYDLSKGEFFFDRNSHTFISVINLYRTGKLHLIGDGCVLALNDELIYWGVGEDNFELCCQDKYYHKRTNILEELQKEVDLLRAQRIETFEHHCCSSLREKLWDLFEHPHSSTTARIISFISIAFIVISSVTMTLGTIDGIACLPNVSITDSQTGQVYQDTECREPLPLFIIETICIIWFTIEYLIRAFATSNKSKFFKSVLNIIDLVSIVPFYVSIILETLDTGDFKNLKPVRKTLQVFRILRIARILKLARHSTGLQALGYTLKRSYKELSMLLMFFGISVLLFSSLTYFAEKDDNFEQFRSIPHAFWWASITMTTVGYGDMYPKTVWGKIIGTVCGVCGVLVIALPIPIIVNHFSEYYKEQLRHEMPLKFKESVDRAKISELILMIHNTNILTDEINERRKSGDPLHRSSISCGRKPSLSSSKLSHAIDLFSDNNNHQNLKQQDDDGKKGLLSPEDILVDHQPRNIESKC